jgi:restriction endonuclease S subunit
LNSPFDEALYKALLEGHEIAEINYSRIADQNRYDSEFFQNKFLQAEQFLVNNPHFEIGEKYKVTDGEHGSVKVRKHGIKYLMAENIREGYVDITNVKYVDEEVDRRNARARVSACDILVSIKGSLGQVAVAEDWLPPANMNRDVAILKPISSSVTPEYLAVFLMSRYGALQSKRGGSGGVQQMITLERLRKFIIPSFSSRFYSLVSDLYREFQLRRIEANRIYRQADNVFLEALGFHSLQPGDENTNVKSFKESFLTTGRLDAEYYQQQFDYARLKLKELGPNEVRQLGQLVKVITNGHTPLRHDLSVGDVLFLTAEHVSDFRIDFDTDKRILTEHHTDELQRTSIESNDLLITIKGKIGNVAVVEGCEQPTNINQDVGLLRLIDGLHPYYVAGFINSDLGKLFVSQLSTGQINPFLGLGNLKLLPIPFFEQAFEIGESVRRKVMEAVAMEMESKRLLDIAKEAVELAVELGEAKGIEFTQESR